MTTRQAPFESLFCVQRSESMPRSRVSSHISRMSPTDTQLYRTFEETFRILTGSIYQVVCLASLGTSLTSFTIRVTRPSLLISPRDLFLVVIEIVQRRSGKLDFLSWAWGDSAQDTSIFSNQHDMPRWVPNSPRERGLFVQFPFPTHLSPTSNLGYIISCRWRNKSEGKILS